MKPSENPSKVTRAISTLALLAALIFVGAPVTRASSSDPDTWPAVQRSFWEDGPSLLLSQQQREKFLAADEAGRTAFIAKFLADPIPATKANELVEGIERRRRLVRHEFLSPLDDRARLLFLHGAPDQREPIACGEVYKPLELWTYGKRTLVLYRPGPSEPFQLWTPLDGKPSLYTDEMKYYLEQWAIYKNQILGRRFDLQICPKAVRKVDGATGVSGLYGGRRNRPTVVELQRYLAPPANLADWARKAAATDTSGLPEPLPLGSLDIHFPAWHEQRIDTRFIVSVPASANLKPHAKSEETKGKPELDLLVEGAIEEQGHLFDQLRARFEPPPPGDHPLALVVDEPLRPDHTFLVRLRVTDRASGRVAYISRGFTVPSEPKAEAAPSPDTLYASAAQLAEETHVKGKDSLVLFPPTQDVVVGLWRAEVAVTGQRIVKVTFSVDGKPQLTITRPPFSAEVRLDPLPHEQVVKAAGYDREGKLVASDEVVLNQPRGAFRVDILSPARGFHGSGKTTARAEVTVPEGRSLTEVDFSVNNEKVATRKSPPWSAQIDVPAESGVTYLTVTATLDDSTKTEAVRFLNAPKYLDIVDVTLVELYTAVTNRHGRPVEGLSQNDFKVLEDGRPQKIQKFQQVQNLPLTVGVTIDTSGSMASSLGDAQTAATDFLTTILKPGDRCFVLSFSDQPRLLMAPTSDKSACTGALGSLRAQGATSLYDALVTSLYYFRAFRGQRALIVLSDGEDNTSHLTYRSALEFARRSGVAIYTVGLRISVLDRGVRSKLAELARETGGRSFFITGAKQLAGVYAQIEKELRTRYLITYTSDRPPGKKKEFRTIKVEVDKPGLTARTIHGYYP